MDGVSGEVDEEVDILAVCVWAATATTMGDVQNCQ